MTDQIAMLVPILLIASALFNAWRHWRAGRPPGADLYRILAAAPWLAVVEWRLLRELSYAELVFPVVAAMSARLIVGPPRDDRDARRQRSAGTVVATARWAIAGALALITAVSIVAHTRHTEIFSLSEIPNSVGLAFHQLIVSPPIEGLLPAAIVKAYTRAQWDAGRLDWGRVAVRYMHDCSVAGDRILVTGSTPYHIAYYVNRTIAGGHLFWRHSWRSDPMRERLSLDLIQRQSVPFVLSINDPALTDFARYPAIHRHLASHYVALDGTGGHVLIDARRQPTGTYEQLGFPCFR